MDSIEYGDCLPKNFIMVSVIHTEEYRPGSRIIVTATDGSSCEGNISSTAKMPNDTNMYAVLLDSRTWQSPSVPIA